MQTTVFFMTVNNEGKNIQKELDYINFDVVLVNRGYFPQLSCVWMRWLKGEEKMK